MNDAVIGLIIGLLGAPVAAFVTWMLNRRKNVSEIYAALTGSAQSAVETMQTAMETLHEELMAAQEKIERLIQENQRMREELSTLRQQNLVLLQENHTLHKKLDDLVTMLHETGELPTVSDEQSSRHGN